MFHRLFGLFVAGKMIAFAVTRRRRPMRVRRLLVKLSRPLMRIVCHFYSPRTASSTLARPPRDVHRTHKWIGNATLPSYLSGFSQRKSAARRAALESILSQLHPTTPIGAFAL
jgi:hypothetical protein